MKQDEAVRQLLASGRIHHQGLYIQRHSRFCACLLVGWTRNFAKRFLLVCPYHDTKDGFAVKKKMMGDELYRALRTLLLIVEGGKSYFAEQQSKGYCLHYYEPSSPKK